MNKKAIFAAISIMLLVLPSMSNALDVRAPLKEYPARDGTEQIPDLTYFPTAPGGLILSPGDTVGWTQYDYQTNGSTGNRVVVDASGVVHCSWMNGDPYPSIRRVFYNCKTSGGWSYPGSGTPVSYRSGDGYTNISSTPDSRAGIAYHNFATGAETLYYALDIAGCLGTFDYYRPPNRAQGLVGAWPYITIQGNGNIHVTSTTQTGSVTFYTRSTNSGVNWTPVQRVDTLTGISQIITSSPVSNKVAIVYVRDNPDDMAGTTGDIYYIQSNDGLTWDWVDGRVNVTNYGPDEDSLSASSDLDAVYDFNDNLNIVWNAHWEVNNSYYYFMSWLYHFSVSSGNITEIIHSDSLWDIGGCDWGGWNWHYCKMSIGSDQSNKLFVAYTDFDSSDCSACGFANGDIYAHRSSDGGATWSPRVNVTNSQSPGCLPGDCESDNWSSLAEKVDDYMHLFYVNDRDAGGIPQTECGITDNPMLYYAAPVSLLGIDDDIETPRNFSLSQNYPNPFNAATRIEFALKEASHISLSIFDVRGALVETLIDKKLSTGNHSVIWNADKLSSGTYYYSLKTVTGSETKKMTLMK